MAKISSSCCINNCESHSAIMVPFDFDKIFISYINVMRIIVFILEFRCCPYMDRCFY